MKINLEQAQQIQDFVNKASRIFNVPAYVVYSYIRIKAEQNGYTVTKQIEKFSKYVDKKEKVKFNRHANKIESNRRMLENDIHRHWE